MRPFGGGCQRAGDHGERQGLAEGGAAGEVGYQFRHPNLVIRTGKRGAVITSWIVPIGEIHEN